MNQDNIENKYNAAIQMTHDLIKKLDDINEHYTDNYNNLSWSDRKPNIIKLNIKARQSASNIIYALTESILEENIINKERSENE